MRLFETIEKRLKIFHTSQKYPNTTMRRVFVQPPRRYVRRFSGAIHGRRHRRHLPDRMHPSLGVTGYTPLRQRTTVYLQACEYRLRPPWYPQSQHQRLPPLYQRRERKDAAFAEGVENITPASGAGSRSFRRTPTPWSIGRARPTAMPPSSPGFPNQSPTPTAPDATSSPAPTPSASTSPAPAAAVLPTTPDVK